jgi:peptidyl-prolyl cis-trans isomerase A (cyclophilin A)/peptidyl-prolyl cis-trans isomerase B (cyclophilin B)
MHTRRNLLSLAACLLISPAMAADESASASASASAASTAAQASTPAMPAAKPGPRVLLKTNMGEIVLELNPDKAPKTSANFIKYVKKGFYSGTIFHRVIPNFMIQGGGFSKAMQQKTTEAAIENEAANGLTNDQYTVAMARTGDPHSATAQFFINVNDNTFLNYPGRDGWGYCVFGKVIKGTEVVDKIKLVETGNANGHQNVPKDAITIDSATLLP